MKEEIENIIGYLKKMIDKNSSNYLIDNSFVVYTELIKHNNVDKKNSSFITSLFSKYKIYKRINF